MPLLPPTRRLLRATALTGSLALAVAACGLDSSAVQSLRSAQGLSTAAGGAAGTTPGSSAAASAAAAGAASSGLGGTGSAAGTAGSGTTGSGLASSGLAGSGTAGSGASGSGTSGSAATGTASGQAATTAAGGCGVPTGGSTTGVSATTIDIGLHAPLTGTGTPFPNSSFVEGAAKFFQQPGISVCGRRVVTDFQDDTYTPAGATRVCSQMAHRDFLVVGGAGTDQIQACATDTDIDSTGTPYLSAGVTTNGLTALPNYFAVSLTYQQQGSLVVQDARNQGFAAPPKSSQGTQWAVVTANTRNFDDATQGIDSALSAAGVSYTNFRVDQSGSYDSAATQLGQTLALDGFKSVYVDLAPGYFVFMVKGYYNVDPTGAGVTWTGPGVTFTDFEVAQLVCEGSGNAIAGHAYFLAPFPGLDHATPAFSAAFGGSYDDIEWSLWGLDQLIYQMLQRASDNLTRQHFIATVLAGSFPGGTFPAVAFHGQHFGGTAAWVQRIDCSKSDPDQSRPGYWDTVGSAPLSR